MLLDDYTPFLVGLVLDVYDAEKLASVKQSLVKFFEHLTDEDRVYLYDTDSLIVPRRRGHTLGQIINYVHPKSKLGSSLKQCVTLLNAEDDEDYKKVIYVVVDKVDPLDNYQVRKAVLLDRDEEFEFVFLCLNFESYEKLIITDANYIKHDVSGGIYGTLVKTLWPDFEPPVEEVKEKVKKVKEPKVEKQPIENIKINVPKISLGDLEELDEDKESGDEEV